MENLENQKPDTEQEPEQQEEQPDALVLLCNRLGAIEAALGIGNCEASPSSLMNRLGAIETNLTKDLRERNLPPSITKAQAANPCFLRKAGIDLKDFTTGRVRIEG